jgi:hypothetical protein
MTTTKPFVNRELQAIVDRVIHLYVLACERGERDAVIDHLISELNEMRPAAQDARLGIDPGGRVVEVPGPNAVLTGTFARAVGVAAESVTKDRRLEPAMATEIWNARNGVRARWADDLPDV